jgi:hypothetical protein
VIRPVDVRLATDADVADLAALRRAWTESTDDPDFEARFAGAGGGGPSGNGGGSARRDGG